MAATAPTPPHRVRVRLRRTPTAPSEKLWAAVPPDAVHVGCLVAAIARAGGVAKKRLVVSIDGFELPPTQPIALVREGDVLDARVCHGGGGAGATPGSAAPHSRTTPRTQLEEQESVLPAAAPPHAPRGSSRTSATGEARATAAPPLECAPTPKGGAAVARKRRRGHSTDDDGHAAAGGAAVAPPQLAPVAEAACAGTPRSASSRRKRRRLAQAASGGEASAAAEQPQPRAAHVPSGVSTSGGSGVAPPPPVLLAPPALHAPAPVPPPAPAPAPPSAPASPDDDIAAARALALQRLGVAAVAGPPPARAAEPTSACGGEAAAGLDAQLLAQMGDITAAAAAGEGADAGTAVDVATPWNRNAPGALLPLTRDNVAVGARINYGLREMDGFDRATGGFRTTVRAYRGLRVVGVSGSMLSVTGEEGEADTVHLSAMLAPTVCGGEDAMADVARDSGAPDDDGALRGTVAKWFPKKKYGFIKAAGVAEDIFAHASKFDGFATYVPGAPAIPAAIGTSVRVWISRNGGGNPVAERVLLDAAVAPAPMGTADGLHPSRRETPDTEARGDALVVGGGGDGPPPTTAWRGIVKTWNAARSYGFIQATDPATGDVEDVFTHVKALCGKGDALRRGFAVALGVEVDWSGRRRAAWVEGSGVGWADEEAPAPRSETPPPLPTAPPPSAEAPPATTAGGDKPMGTGRPLSDVQAASEGDAPAGAAPAVDAAAAAAAPKRLPGVVRPAARPVVPPAPAVPPPPPRVEQRVAGEAPRTTAGAGAGAGAAATPSPPPRTPKRRPNSVAGAMASLLAYQQAWEVQNENGKTHAGGDRA